MDVEEAGSIHGEEDDGNEPSHSEGVCGHLFGFFFIIISLYSMCVGGISQAIFRQLLRTVIPSETFDKERETQPW